MSNTAYPQKKPVSDKTHAPKQRNCLMCRKTFTSTWPGERICLSCKQTNVWREPLGVWE